MLLPPKLLDDFHFLSVWLFTLLHLHCIFSHPSFLISLPSTSCLPCAKRFSHNDEYLFFPRLQTLQLAPSLFSPAFAHAQRRQAYGRERASVARSGLLAFSYRLFTHPRLLHVSNLFLFGSLASFPSANEVCVTLLSFFYRAWSTNSSSLLFSGSLSTAFQPPLKLFFKTKRLSSQTLSRRPR